MAYKLARPLQLLKQYLIKPEYEMNNQRLKELAMINACRDDSRDVQFYETNMSKRVVSKFNHRSRSNLTSTKALVVAA